MPRLAHATIALLLAACSVDAASPSTGSSDDGSSGSTAPGTTAGTTGPDAATGDLPVPTSDPTPTSTTTTTTDGTTDDPVLTTGTSEPSDTTGADDTTGESPVEPEPLCDAIAPCSSVQLTAVEHTLKLLDGCAFALAPSDFAAGIARADALLARVGTAVSLDDVLDNLNRTATPGLSAYQADRMKNHDYTGFRWDSGDGAVTYWYPQGITGSSDARDNGKISGRRLLLVSWYHKIDRKPTDPPAKGARLSLVDITNLNAIRYRHLLLVTPTGSGDNVNFGAANYDNGDPLHAGGIVWIGDRLYVAETTRGARVYDMSRIFRVKNTDDNDAIGISGGEVNAHGYLYAVPEIGRYHLTGDSCKFRFSALSLDRGAEPPVLIAAEYQTDLTGRIARWPIDLASGALVTSGGVAHALDAALSGQSRVQGAITHDGVYYISSSSQAQQWGRLYRNIPGGQSKITAWPDGPEDLYVERDRKLIWTPAEHPNKRVTLGIPMQGY